MRWAIRAAGIRWPCSVRPRQQSNGCTYADSRAAGTAHIALLLGGLAALGVDCAARGGAARRTGHGPGDRGRDVTVAGRDNAGADRVGDGRLLERGDLDAARDLLPSLCGRDPASLDSAGPGPRGAGIGGREHLGRPGGADSVGRGGGVPGVLVYRGANTLDAMIGHRSAALRPIRLGRSAIG